MTPKQKNDIEVSRYFIPRVLKHIPVTKEHEEQYIAVSERGEKNAGKFDTNPLIQGKRNRGLHMQLWEEGILEGTTNYFTLLGGFQNNKKWWQFWKSRHKLLPRPVVDFMKKEMFKGIDAEQIEKLYVSLKR